MNPTRRARLESLILQELSTVVRGLKDPRIDGGLTLTGCEVSPDGAYATVKVSLLEMLSSQTPDDSDGMALNEGRLIETVAGLNHSSGFVRKHLAKVLTTKHIPSVSFKPDMGLNNTIRVNQLLEGLKSEKPD
jgi:ribosome-binding factor A